jgi:hypothetical protein
VVGRTSIQLPTYDFLKLTHRTVLVAAATLPAVAPAVSQTDPQPSLEEKRMEGKNG